MKGVRIERAVLADTKAYGYVQIKAFGGLQGGKLSNTYHSETLISMMIQSSECYKLVTEAHEVIGGIVLCPHGDTGLIKRMFVLPKYQGQGYGKALIDFAENRYNGVKEWQANVDVRHPEASRFFMRFGYRQKKKDKQFLYFVKEIS